MVGGSKVAKKYQHTRNKSTYLDGLICLRCFTLCSIIYVVSDSSGEFEKIKPTRWLRRLLLSMLVFVVVLGVIVWGVLPRIAERLIPRMITDAGLGQADLKVVKIGWNEALIENLVISDQGWKIKADGLSVSYDLTGLLDSRVEDVEIDGLIAELNLSTQQTEKPEGDSYALIHSLPDVFNHLNSVRARDATIVIVNGDRMHRVDKLDVDLSQSAAHNLLLSAEAKDYSFLTHIIHQGDKSDVSMSSTTDMPDRFVDLIETILTLKMPLIPEGIDIGRADFSGDFQVIRDSPSPLVVVAELERVVFNDDKTSIRAISRAVRMHLDMKFTGSGEVAFSGVADTLSLPASLIAGCELNLKTAGVPQWETSIVWNDDSVKLIGSVNQLDLTGEYNGRSVSLDTGNAKFSLDDNGLKVDGSLSNGHTLIPFVYEHSFKEQFDERWIMTGELGVGPIKHHEPLPLLDAMTDALDDVSVNGISYTKMDFSLGSHEPFRGALTTQISDAEIAVSEGKLTAVGVDGMMTLEIMPQPDAGSNTEEPSHYTLDFAAKKITVASIDALGYDLVHEAKKPIVITGKGNIGVDKATLKGEVKNLQLYGEKDGLEILLADTSVCYQVSEDQVHAHGKTFIGENEIPFSYWHDRETQGDKWNLKGWLKIDSADLKHPVDNGGMLVEVIKGKTIAGKVSMKMDFNTGNDVDFDGVLVASIAGGTLTMEDDGLALEGLSGDIRLSSLKEIRTEGFHRVTAKKIKAFDAEMTNLRLDYQLLANGDIVVQNVALSALGGIVKVDSVVMPGGDANYQLQLRMQGLDLAQIAKLFPDFDGSITGKIDGLLPLQNIDGEFRPVRGDMYLTPSSRAKLRYDVGNKFSAGMNPKTEEYKSMKMVEDSLKNLELKVLDIRLFDPMDENKAMVLKLRGQAPSVPGSPPIHLNINGFKPDDDTVNFFDLLLRHRDKLNFGL